MRLPRFWVLDATLTRGARHALFVTGVTVAALASPTARADGGQANASKTAKLAPDPKSASSRKPWCAPEVTRLADHVCYFDGEPESRTLVIYLHGVYANTPGFQWLQQRALALQAKRHKFTLLLPTAPATEGGYAWPTSHEAREREEPAILRSLNAARASLEKRRGRRFDEVFVVGFSSGAYYASSLALRGALDVDGYMVFAGGASWVKSTLQDRDQRRPVFVGVSAADKQTAGHSRGFAGTLAALGWPYRVEERNAGHTVDWALFTHGLAWLHQRTKATDAVER